MWDGEDRNDREGMTEIEEKQEQWEGAWEQTEYIIVMDEMIKE